MTSARKLMLGFGTLIVLLVVAILTMTVRLLSIEGEVDEMANDARTRSAAVRELKSSILGYALDVRTHLRSGDPETRQAAAKRALDVARYLAEYERVASTANQRALAVRFAALWRDFKAVGGDLLNARNRQLSAGKLARLHTLRVELEGFLGDAMQIDATATYEGSREVAFQRMEAVLGFAVMLLAACVAIAGATSVAVGRGIMHAETSLRDHRERLRVTLASIGDAIIATDDEGRVTTLNPVAEALTGWTEDEAAGRSLGEVFRVVDEKTRRGIEDPVKKVRSQGDVVSLTNHTVLIHKDGSERPINDSAAPIRDAAGRVVGVVLVFRDISEYRRAEHQRREEEHRFRIVIEQISDYAIFTTDPKGRATSWNEGVLRVLGFDEVEFIGKDIVPTIFTPEDVRSGVARRELEKAAATGSAGDDRWMRKKDGTAFFALGVATAYRDETGALIGFTKIMRDGTERKLIDDELRTLAADLSEADRRKNEFLATLAHELRNPLAPIRNAVEIIRAMEGDRHAVRSASDIMERQIGQLVHLVDDLLDVSRLSRGRIDLRTERVELASVVSHALESVRPLCESMGHQLNVTLPAHPVYLHADPIRLAQVVDNLLTNACKFTDPDGRIDLLVEPEGEQVVLRVRDNSIGMTVQQLPAVFEMFKQLDTSLERSRSGLGIGLTLVKSLVEMHGGTVAARSAGTGQGSEFVISLPAWVAMSEAPPQPEPDAGAPTSAVALTILVVDDNRDSATSLALLLKMTGHETYTAYDGVEAVESAATFQPDVILLDIGLPKLNGLEVARKIRAAPWGKRMSLVALTGWGQAEDRRRSAEVGFNAHLVKPVDFSALTKLLAELRPTPV